MSSLLQKLQESIRNPQESPLVRYLRTGQKPEKVTEKDKKLFKISGDPKTTNFIFPNIFPQTKKEKPSKELLNAAKRNYSEYLSQTYLSLLPDEQKEFKERTQKYLDWIKTGGGFERAMHERFLLDNFLSVPPLKVEPRFEIKNRREMIPLDYPHGK